jgi:hypothetical protein
MTAPVAARLETPPTATDIDSLAVEFLELEDKTDRAYAVAVALDEPHERMKEELITLVEEFGSIHAGTKLLHGLTHELVATFGVSTSVTLLRSTVSPMYFASTNRPSFSSSSSSKLPVTTYAPMQVPSSVRYRSR